MWLFARCQQAAVAIPFVPTVCARSSFRRLVENLGLSIFMDVFSFQIFIITIAVVVPVVVIAAAIVVIVHTYLTCAGTFFKGYSILEVRSI
jgi:hypothetical protein